MLSRLRIRPIGPTINRGFTLLELVAVVTVISVFAALAIPATVNQLRNRRVYQAAREVAILYRQARMQALGRGSAVLVRFSGGQFTVLEAVRSNASGTCTTLPFSGCRQNNWGNAAEVRTIDAYQPPATGELATLTVGITNNADTDVANLDICFSPMGRAFVRTIPNNPQPFDTLSQTFVATIARAGAYLPRKVLLMPNGGARMMTLTVP